jgi:aminoglycoside phosphotransferase (APT) family kinase protein
MPSKKIPNPYISLTALGVAQPTSVSTITGGADTMMWRVEDRNQVYALRVFRPEQYDRYQKEQMVMELAVRADLPVPRVVAAEICDSYPTLLLSWCSGQTLADAIRQQPWRVWTLGRLFGEMQARMHAVAVPSEIESRLADWKTWKVGDNVVLQQALGELKTNSSALLHLDYHLENVMVEGNQVTGVIDWANVHVGDKRADIARTYTILRVEPWNDRPSLWLGLMRWLLASAWRRGYAQVSGSQENMALFYVWAGEVMVRDLTYRIDQPDNWFQQPHLATIQAWTDRWREKAGLGVNIG